MAAMSADTAPAAMPGGYWQDKARQLQTALNAERQARLDAEGRVSILEALTSSPLFSHRALTEKLGRIMGPRFGARFLDPPDGGDVAIHDQVERMADALLAAEAALAAEREKAVRDTLLHVRNLLDANQVPLGRDFEEAWNANAKELYQA